MRDNMCSCFMCDRYPRYDFTWATLPVIIVLVGCSPSYPPTAESRASRVTRSFWVCCLIVVRADLYPVIHPEAHWLLRLVVVSAVVPAVNSTRPSASAPSIPRCG